MPKITLTLDNNITQEFELTQEQTRVGRRPFNDIVLENLAVSGEHARLSREGQQVLIEDLNSTNGTYVNGKPVKKQLLQDGDLIEIGKCRLTYWAAAAASDSGAPQTTLSGAAIAAAAAVPAAPLQGSLKVLSGPASGRVMALTKQVTTFGKPGVAVAAITRQTHAFVVQHVEGKQPPMVNGAAVGTEPVVLHDGDQIILAGTQMQFIKG